MMVVVFKVQGQRNGPNDLTLVHPRFGKCVPRYSRMLGEPLVQNSFAGPECRTGARAGPTQLNSQLSREHTAQRAAQCRTLGIAFHVEPQPSPQVLFAV